MDVLTQGQSILGTLPLDQQLSKEVWPGLCICSETPFPGEVQGPVVCPSELSPAAPRAGELLLPDRAEKSLDHTQGSKRTSHVVHKPRIPQTDPSLQLQMLAGCSKCL